MANYTVSRFVDASAAVTVARTMLRLVAPANQSITVYAWWIEFDSVASSDKPIRVELLSETATVSAPTGGTAVTPLPLTPDTAVANTTCICDATSGEGTATYAATAFENHFIPATGGLYVQYPLGREIVIAKALAFRIRVTCVTNTVNMNYGAEFSE